MPQHNWSQGPGNMRVVCHGWCTTTCNDCLFTSECSTSLLWQPIIVFGTKLQGTSSTTVCQSPKFLVVSICDLPEVINCQFLQFAIAPLVPVHFLSPDQQYGIHCLIICAIQLLTMNNSGRTWCYVIELYKWTFTYLRSCGVYHCVIRASTELESTSEHLFSHLDMQICACENMSGHVYTTKVPNVEY